MDQLNSNSKISETANDADETSSPAQIVASIDDLLIEVFLRLPLKPLVRFKLVSKHWNSIISDPKTVDFLHNRPAVGLFCQEDTGYWSTYIVPFDKSTDPTIRELDFMEDCSWPWGIKGLACCKGLFLCSDNSYGNNYHIQNYYIYNLTTKKHRKLPKLDAVVVRGPVKSHWMYLAFDPYKSPHYKVVCLLVSGRRWDYTNDHQYQFRVYSSETDSWKKHSEPFTARPIFVEDGIYWNGAIHWLDSGDQSSKRCIYFNPDDNNSKLPYEVTPSLPILYDSCSRCFYGLRESSDHLHYIVRGMSECTVCEMKRDYSEWFIKYKVDFSSCVPNWLICTLVRGKKDEDSFLVLWDMERRLIRYNLVSKTSEVLHQLKSRASPNPIPYIECLYSV